MEKVLRFQLNKRRHSSGKPLENKIFRMVLGIQATGRGQIRAYLGALKKLEQLVFCTVTAEAEQGI